MIGKWTAPGWSTENLTPRPPELALGWTAPTGTFVPLGGTSNGRLELWGRLLAELDSPIKWAFGLGPGEASRLARVGQERWGFYHPHNEFVRPIVDTGAVGVFLTGIFLLAFLRSALSPAGPLGRLYVFLSLGSLAVVSFFDNPLVSPYLFVPFVVLMGFSNRSGFESVAWQNKTLQRFWGKTLAGGN